MKTLTELAREALAAQAAVSYGPGTFPEREARFFAARDALIAATERVDAQVDRWSGPVGRICSADLRAAIEGPKE